MILKGNQRGGGSQLAAHLMNSFDNEVIEIAEVSGTIARDLPGAFNEMYAHSLSTKAEKYLYSLSLNPDQDQGRLTRDQYFDLIARTERSLRLIGQPRAVVFHEKRDEQGELRQHCHVVWSRTLIEENRAVQMSHDRLKLRTVARQFARDHGLELPDGMKRDGNADRFNNRAKQENLPERQQKERTGISKAERMADITACWNGTKTGSEFVHAMEDKGYYLARGDSGRYVVVDLYGEVHSLYKQIEGVKSAGVKERLIGYPLDKQPDVESARAYARQKLQERQQALEKGSHARQEAQEPSRQEATGAKAAEGNLLEHRKDALAERQAARRSDLDRQRIDLYARQFRERGALRELQAAEKDGVIAARLEKQPKGLAALLTRITGIGKVVSWVQDKADMRREAAHKQQTDALLRRHGRELKEMDRHDRALARLEARENRAASHALRREACRQLRVRTFALKPEFDKALASLRKPPSGETGGTGRGSMFNRLASGIGLTRGDLQAAFERATSGKTVRPADSDTHGRAPADAGQPERARKLADDLNRRQPRREDRDRDRER